MEDDKKKKKSKRKRNKQQAKATAAAADDSASSNAGETISVSGEQDNLSNVVIDDEKKAQNTNGCVTADSEKLNSLQGEARLRDMVKQLLYEKDSYIQRQADLEIKCKQLQSENDSWHQKEVSLEQRISQLLQENAALSFEQRNLVEKNQHVEKEKHVLVETENLDKKMISNLNSENTKLKMQVLELEEARNNISHDNKQLLDNVAALQSRVHDLETSLASTAPPTDAQRDAIEKEGLNSEMEEIYALIGKLMAENADLVEKVNQMSMELGQRAVVPEFASVIPDYSSANPVPTSTKDIQEDNSLSTKSVEPFGTAPIRDEQRATDQINSEHVNIVRHESETSLTGEIVQISLDENEIQDLESQASVGVEEESVPLADAPLIGAPFRLISFFANYVSGADLVNKDPSKQ